MNLQQLLPILWEHERRASPQNAVVAEFVKRFLVVVLVPDGIFDLYYTTNDNHPNNMNELVAFSFSIRQQTVLHSFMYFCKDDHAKSGIWFHNIRLSLSRSMELAKLSRQKGANDNDTKNSITKDGCSDECEFFLNAQVHQTSSKQNAGLIVAGHDDEQLLSKLYPFTRTLAIPESVANMTLWNDCKK